MTSPIGDVEVEEEVLTPKSGVDAKSTASKVGYYGSKMLLMEEPTCVALLKVAPTLRGVGNNHGYFLR